MKANHITALCAIARQAVILLLFSILPGSQFFAQNYFELKNKMERHLDSLHQITPDSLFYHEGSEYSQFRQWVEFWDQRLYLDGSFDNYYKRQKEGLERLSQRSWATYNAQWHEVGPTDEPSGEMPPCNVTQSAGIGPVEFIRFYRQNPQHMLTGSTKGGLFYSKDGGDSWVNAGSDHWLGVSAVSWAEFKVDDPEVAYAVNGEPDDNVPGPIKWTGGIYRARKNGPIGPNTQWDLIASIANCFNGNLDCRIKKILTDPYDPDVLYVASSEGLYKSSNVNAAAPTWQNILQDNIWDVEIRPGTGNHMTLYVSFDANPNYPNPSPNSNLVSYSTDGGAIWTQQLLNSPSNIAQTNSASDISHVSIEVSEAPGFQKYIYLYYYGSSAAHKNIYRYDFPAQTYTTLLSNIEHSAFSCCFGGGSAFGVSQSGTDEIIFIAYDDRYARWKNGALSVFGYSHANVNDYHVDLEGITLHPNNNNEIWMASHGGPYKSTDQGNRWVPKMKGVGVAMAFYMATSYENPEDILIGTYHDGCILTQGLYANNWNPPWKYVYGCDGQKVLIDHKNPNYMYGSGVGSYWGISADGGVTPFSSIGFYTSTGWWDFEAVLNKEKTNVIYGRQNDEVNREMNRGNTAGTVISDLATLSGANPSCSGVSSLFTFDSNKDLLMAGFYNCSSTNAACSNCTGITSSWELYYTLKATDPAINPLSDWHKINLCNCNRSAIDVELDPADPNNLYVILYPDYSGGDMKIINKVLNFTSASPTIIPLTGNFPPNGLQSNCLALEKGSNGGIYVATDMGAVFYTNNEMIATATAAGNKDWWVLFGSNYPHLTTSGLEINYKVNRIRAAPFSRGVWEADLYCPASPFAVNNCVNCSPTNTNFWEGTTVTASSTVLTNGTMIMRGTESVEILPGATFSLFDPSGSPNNHYKMFIHGCQPGQGNTFDD